MCVCSRRHQGTKRIQTMLLSSLIMVSPPAFTSSSPQHDDTGRVQQAASNYTQTRCSHRNRLKGQQYHRGPAGGAVCHYHVRLDQTVIGPNASFLSQSQVAHTRSSPPPGLCVQLQDGERSEYLYPRVAEARVSLAGSSSVRREHKWRRAAPERDGTGSGPALFGPCYPAARDVMLAEEAAVATMSRASRNKTF